MAKSTPQQIELFKNIIIISDDSSRDTTKRIFGFIDSHIENKKEKLDKRKQSDKENNPKSKDIVREEDEEKNRDDFHDQLMFKMDLE